MNYAVTDIGSNTVKCEVFSYTDGKLLSIDFSSEQLGLISRIKSGVLPYEDISLLCETVSKYKALAEKHNAKLYCFATESLRRVSNFDEVKKAVSNRLGLEIDLISGKDEAILSFEGFQAQSPEIECGIMADMGGGSTEILKFDNGRPIRSNSFRFGCLSLRSEYVKGRFPTDDEKQWIINRVHNELNIHSWIGKSNRLCLIGGTGSAVAKMAIELGFTDIPEFKKETFFELFDYFNDINNEKTELLEKHIPARVETILPGMCAYKEIIDHIGAETVYISSGGIRGGYIYRMINEENE